MAVIGTFSSFTTARLGIYASQASLNVTGNNIANINTKGYTRQRMDLVSLYPSGAGKYANMFDRNIGYGVLAQTRTQLRDPFLDIRYRNENTNLEASAEKLDGLYQLSHILDEVGKGTGKEEGYGVIQARLKTFIEALQNLKVNVGSQEHDALVRGEAEALVKFFNTTANGLQDVYDGKVKDFTESLTAVNKLLTDIRDLNEHIRTQALYGDNALELRDQRNLALDALSGYMKINVEYSMERIDQFTEVEKITVTLAGSKGPDGKPIKLIDGIYGGQINLQPNEPAMNPNYDPVAINKEKEKAKQDAEAADPLKSGDPANPTKWETQVAQKVAAAQAQAEIDHDKDDPDWIQEVADRVAAAEAEAEEAVKKVTDPNDPDLQTKIDEAKAKAKAETEAAAEQERLDLIKADVAAAEKAAWKDAAAERQELIDNAVKVKEDELIEAGGKYIKKPVDPNDPNEPVKYTNDINEAKTYENEKFLLQVEPLKDRRDRLMIEANTVSKKSEVVELNDTVLYGSLQSMREMLTEEGEYASKEDLNKDQDPPRLSGDPDASTKRGIPYYQKALDSLAKKFAEEFNQANQLPATTVYQMNQAVPGTITGADTFLNADGDPVQYKDEDGNLKDITVDDVTKVIQQPKLDENGKPVLDANGDPVMEEVRVPYDMADGDQYEKASELLTLLAKEGKKDPLYEFYDGGVLFSTSGNNNNPDGITAKNISISNGWANNVVHILNDKRPDEYTNDGEVIPGSSRNENIQHMITLFDKKLEYAATDVQADSAATDPIFKGSFREVYTAIGTTLGDDESVTIGKVENYSVLTLDLENQRQSVSGVDLNDEATNMMQFSKSYSAACRLLTTIDSMLDKLINGTAV